MNSDLLRWPDLLVIALSFSVMVLIGFICAHKTKTSEDYFLAGRKMPGWVVGFSIMATVISSMTFLAGPGFAYKENWRYIPCHIGLLIALLVKMFLYMPFFRRAHITTPYEYLERRFGTWARVYTALCFVLFQMTRMGIILYVVSLAIQEMTGFEITWIILFFGIIAASYTIAGGLEAVIWTDLIQGCALIIGGFICLPILISKLPGGFAQIIDVAAADGKLSMGSTTFTLSEKTIWVMIVMNLFNHLQSGCTDQMTIQRYCAPKSKSQARKALILGTALSIPVWVYFTFIGTAIYVFYKQFPDPALNEIAKVPERILPFFILREIPAGLAGFVIAGLLAAAMSTLDSSINASAATLTSDFYRRLFIKNRDERHYLSVGRWLSVGFGMIMITVALIIHYTRTQTLADLQMLLTSVLSGGLLGLFWSGLMTRKTSSKTAAIAIVCAVLVSGAWLFVPRVSRIMPDKFWMIVIVNIFTFVFAYILSFIFRKKNTKNLKGLTIWTWLR